MRVREFLLVFFLIWSLTSCGTVKIEKNLVTLEEGYFQAETRKDAPRSASEDGRYADLIRAYNEINGLQNNKQTRSNDMSVLPGFMLKEPLVRKMVTVAHYSLVEAKEHSVAISKKDVDRFIAMTARRFGAKNTTTRSTTKTDKIIKQYLVTYYSDTEHGFIDREGGVYKRPEIKNSIGNDVITAVVQIVLEGLYDGLLDVPVFKDGDKYLTEKGAEPTVHKLKFAKSEELSDPGSPGIDKYEFKAIRYLSGLAADQSKALSGSAIRAFGDLELGFVIGGHFSIGDNDTLAKIVDTIFEVSSKRIVEAGAYKGFIAIPGMRRIAPDEGENVSPSKQLLHTIKNMESQ